MTDTLVVREICLFSTTTAPWVGDTRHVHCPPSASFHSGEQFAVECALRRWAAAGGVVLVQQGHATEGPRARTALVLLHLGVGL